MSEHGPTAEALARLKMHEQAIGRLYKTYAQRFPEQAEFWSGLSREEDQHAKWIDTLQAEIRDDPTSLVANRFPAEAIEHSIAFVAKLITKANSPDFTPLNAVSAALNLEQGLLENKYFEAFETDKAEVKRLLASLRDEAHAHCLIVQQTWEQARQGVAGPA
ncbi:MAG: ferritin family protein [Planctomycetota bacterium]